MIARWGWLLIWTGLAIALLATLAVCARVLWVKFFGLVDDLGELADVVGVLEVDEPVLERPQLAVLAEARDIRDREDARRAYRIERRRVRLEQRLARARRITSVDASQQQWPSDWVS